MPDIIITPSSGIIDFFPVSTRVGRIEGSGNTINIVNPSGFVAVSGSGLSINTSSPNATFHAYSATSGATILNIEGTNGSLFSVVDNLSGTLMSVNNNAGLPVFEVFSDDRVVAGRFGQNDFIMTSGGNIGIGTGVPSSKFHVVGLSTFNGDVSSTGSFIAGSGSATNPSFEFSGDIDTGLFNASNDTIGFATSGVERLRINNSGNVGIGTTSPNNRLHIVGTGSIDGRLSISPTSAVISPSSVLHISGSVTDNASLLISGPTPVRTFLGAGNSDTVPFLASINENISVSTSGWGFFHRATEGNLHIQRKSGSASWSSVIMMDRSNGNVGIGTGVQATTPPEKLTVDGNIRVADTSVTQGNIVQFNRGGGNQYDYSIGKYSSALAISLSNDSTSQRPLQVGYHSGVTFLPQFHVNGYNGSVGIGTTSPSARLEVATSGTTSLDIAHFSNSNGVERAKISLSSAGDGTFSIIDASNNTDIFLTSNVSTASYINAGNFGVGTTNPTSTLQVSGLITANSGNFTQSLQVNGTGVSISGHTHTTSNITNFSSAVSGLLPTISNSGDNRVLTSIGSTLGINAESNLTFNGSLLTVTGSGIFSSGIEASNFTLGYSDSFSSYCLINNSIDDSLNIISDLTPIYINSTQNISINTDTSSVILQANAGAGSVGIGTTSPQSKLNIVGDVIIDSDPETNTRLYFWNAGIPVADITWDWTNEKLNVNASKVDVAGTGNFTALTINNSGVSTWDVPILSLGTISGTNSINWGTDRTIQSLTLNGSATTLNKGTGWPSTNGVCREVTLNIYASGNTSVTWNIVNDWYRQPDSPLPSGNHIVLFRAISSGIIQGHYIGNKTN